MGRLTVGLLGALVGWTYLLGPLSPCSWANQLELKTLVLLSAVGIFKGTFLAILQGIYPMIPLPGLCSEKSPELWERRHWQSVCQHLQSSACGSRALLRAPSTDTFNPPQPPWEPAAVLLVSPVMELRHRVVT